MKKTYLSALLIGTTIFGASAQIDVVKNISELAVKPSRNLVQQNSIHNTPKATFWSEDFNGGFTTANGTWTTDGPNGNIWKYSTVTSTGQYADPNDVFNSTTGSNGFMIFDADSANAVGVTNFTGSLISPVIDLTGETTAKLTIEQDYRWCCTGTHLITVAVSSDGGSSWSPELDLTVGFVPSPNNSGQQADVDNNGYEYSVNITQYAAGNNIQLRFTWDGVGSGSSHYFWMFDDVKITDLPNNELELGKSWHGDIFNDWEYSMAPLSQAREMIAGVIITNTGGTDETPDVTCTIHDANGVVANPAPIATLIPSGVTDTIWFNTGFTPSANGVYHAEFSIPADFDASNNSSVSSTLTINDNVMAHDYYTNAQFGWDPASASANQVAFAQAGHAWGEIYEVTTNQTVYGMDIFLGSNTTAGIYLEAQVFEYNKALGAFQAEQSATPSDYVQKAVEIINTAASGINTVQTVSFSSPFTMEQGKGYVFFISKPDGTTTERLSIGSSEVAGEDDDFSTIGFGIYNSQNPGPRNYSGFGNSFYIRPNFENTASISENTAVSGLSIYPNPATENITVDFNLANASDVTIEVVDAAGKVAIAKTLTSQAAGKSNVSFETAALNAGVYFVNISTEAGKATQKFIKK